MAKLIEIYFLLFITYSLIGWIIEEIDTYPQYRKFVNRGFLLGPICPIYGSSALIMIFLLGKIEDPLVLFFSAVFICSLAEYVTSYAMEKIYNARWWDYSNYKFNLNGRICLINAIGFGILGLFLIKFLNVKLFTYYMSLSNIMVHGIFTFIFIIFVVDMAVSFNAVNKIKNMSVKFKKLDNTEEMTKKVRELIGNNFVVIRVFSAFPQLRFNFKSRMKDGMENFKLKAKNMMKK